MIELLSSPQTSFTLNSESGPTWLTFNSIFFPETIFKLDASLLLLESIINPSFSLYLAT